MNNNEVEKIIEEAWGKKEQINKNSDKKIIDTINQSIKDLDYNDKRLTKVVEGYILQVIFYNITGESFCENIECRLNNAHWQKDLLFSQLEISKLCQKHNEILSNLN